MKWTDGAAFVAAPPGGGRKFFRRPYFFIDMKANVPQYLVPELLLVQCRGAALDSGLQI